MNFHGVYINLDDCIDRRLYIEHGLRQNNVLDVYKRLSATNAKDIHHNSKKLTKNELACLDSHIRAVESNKHIDKHLHIIEDDIEFSHSHHKVLDKTLETFDDWDIIFTGLQVPLHKKQLNNFIEIISKQKKQNNNFLIHSMEDFLFVGAFSYIINKNSLNKLSAIYSNINFEQPIDFILREHICLRKSLKAFFIFPFTSMHKGVFDTTMQDRAYELTYKFQFLFQKPLWHGYDLKQTMQEVEEYAMSIGIQVQSTDPSYENIYKELMRMGDKIIRSDDVKGKYNAKG